MRSFVSDLLKHHEREIEFGNRLEGPVVFLWVAGGRNQRGGRTTIRALRVAPTFSFRGTQKSLRWRGTCILSLSQVKKEVEFREFVVAIEALPAPTGPRLQSLTLMLLPRSGVIHMRLSFLRTYDYSSSASASHVLWISGNKRYLSISFDVDRPCHWGVSGHDTILGGTESKNATLHHKEGRNRKVFRRSQNPDRKLRALFDPWEYQAFCWGEVHAADIKPDKGIVVLSLQNPTALTKIDHHWHSRCTP